MIDVRLESKIAEEGYVFHMLDDGAFYITEKNCYDRYYNQQAD